MVRLVLIALAAFELLLATQAHLGERVLQNKNALEHANENAAFFKCGFRGPSPEEDAEIEARLNEHKKKKAESQAQQGESVSVQVGTVIIDVYFHVITRDGVFGDVNDTVIANQMTILNEGFSGINGSPSSLYPGKGTQNECENSSPAPLGTDTPFRFELRDVDRTVNADWFTNWDNGNEEEMKAELRVGGCKTLNVYTTSGEPGGYYGWSSFPSNCGSNQNYDGVVVAWDTLPGSEGFRDMGDTLIHEVGHWSGLSHTFEGGCDGQGDHVDDTPPEMSAHRGCQVGRDTCTRDDLEDPIFNFMDYSDDCCTHTFTDGQVDRMVSQCEVFRQIEFDPTPTPRPTPRDWPRGRPRGPTPSPALPSRTPPTLPTPPPSDCSYDNRRDCRKDRACKWTGNRNTGTCSLE